MVFFIKKSICFLLLLISPFIKVGENIFLKEKVYKNIKQPIFIIGAPRTGSTILYQALTNYSEVSFINNLTCKWHRNILFGFWLSHNRFKDSAHNNFNAEHGNTKKFGQSAPSECGAFWYRWLPRNRHFIDNDEITTKMVNEIYDEVSSVISYFDKPLLFKNLNAGQRLRLIHKAFPQAKFIYIKRDPRFVIRSILKARKKNNIKHDQWWSIMPPNFKELLMLPEEEMVAAQVYYIEKQIELDLQLFAPENIKTIHLQALSKQTVNELVDWMNIDFKKSGKLPLFRKDKLEKLSSDELELLTKLSNKYAFPKEQYI